jgi:hypothetical protein
MLPVIGPSVLLREEALGYDDIQIKIYADCRQQDQQNQQRMVERPAQAALITAQHGVEHPFAGAMKAPLVRVIDALEKQRAHHWGGGERHRERYQDGDRQGGHCEFAEQAPDNAPHQQDQDEYRAQRDAHRHHGEADLAGW